MKFSKFFGEVLEKSYYLKVIPGYYEMGKRDERSFPFAYQYQKFVAQDIKFYLLHVLSSCHTFPNYSSYVKRGGDFPEFFILN